MVEEKRPICKFEMMNKSHTSCDTELQFDKGCKSVMKCHLGMKMMKKTYPVTVCEDIAIGEEEKCVEMVKLKKKKHEEKDCSFHPKTVCKQMKGKECKRRKKIMCNYKDSKHL